MHFLREKPFINGEKAIFVDSKLMSFGIAIICVNFRLLFSKSNVLSDIKHFIIKVLPEDRSHFHIVSLQLFRKSVGFVQKCTVFLQHSRKELPLRDCCQEIRLKTREGNHILFGFVNRTDFVKLFVGCSMVNVEKTDVLRASVDAADVGVMVLVDSSEPIEGFGEENIRLDEDATFFVEYMEHNEPSPYGFEVVFEITLRFLSYSFLQFFESLLDFE